MYNLYYVYLRNIPNFQNNWSRLKVKGHVLLDTNERCIKGHFMTLFADLGPYLYGPKKYVKPLLGIFEKHIQFSEQLVKK